MARNPCQGRLEWAQPPRKAALTSPAPANWELPVPACLWENRPPVPRALPGHLHKTLCLCQFLATTDPSSSLKNQSHQTKEGRLTHATCPERWTLTRKADCSKRDTGETQRNRFKTGTDFRVQDQTTLWIFPPPDLTANPPLLPHLHELQSSHLSGKVGVRVGSDDTTPIIPSRSSTTLPGWKFFFVACQP